MHIRRNLIVTFAATVGLVGMMAGPAGASPKGIEHDTSVRWAGSVVNEPGHADEVAASFTVPTLHCPASGNSYGDSWAGIGGAETSGGIAQTGASYNCDQGAVKLFAWYEFYPKPIRPLSAPHTIHAGDVMVATVTRTSGSNYTDRLRDKTADWAVTNSGTAADADNTAEIVFEEPIEGQIPCPFGHEQFVSGQINGQALGKYGQLIEATLVSGGGSVLATTDDPSSAGTFTVTER